MNSIIRFGSRIAFSKPFCLKQYSSVALSPQKQHTESEAESNWLPKAASTSVTRDSIRSFFSAMNSIADTKDLKFKEYLESLKRDISNRDLQTRSNKAVLKAGKYIRVVDSPVASRALLLFNQASADSRDAHIFSQKVLHGLLALILNYNRHLNPLDAEIQAKGMEILEMLRKIRLDQDEATRNQKEKSKNTQIEYESFVRVNMGYLNHESSLRVVREINELNLNNALGMCELLMRGLIIQSSAVVAEQFLLEAMDILGREADLGCLQKLMFAYAKSGDIDNTRRIFKHMKTTFWPLPYYVYYKMLNSLSKQMRQNRSKGENEKAELAAEIRSILSELENTNHNIPAEFAMHKWVSSV